MANEFSLAGILEQISGLQAQLHGDVDEGKRTVEDNVALGKEQAAAAIKLGELATNQAQYTTEQKLDMEARKKATRETFNVDILNPENQLAYLAREQNAAVRESIENSKRAATLRDTGLFESPLEYLIMRPFATENDAAAKGAADRAVVIDKAIDNLNQQATSTVATQAAIQETYTKEQQALELERVAVEATSAAAKVQMSINQSHLADIRTLREMSVAEVGQAVNGYNLKRQAEEHSARMAELKANREAKLAEKSDKKLGEIELWGAYNLGAKKLGKAPISFEMFSQASKTTVGKAAMAPILNHGLTQAIDAEYSASSGKPVPDVISSNPGEAVALLGQVKGNLAPSASRLSAFLSDTYAEAKAALMKDEKDGKITPEQIAARVNISLADPAVKGGVGQGTVSRMMNNPEAQESPKYLNPYRAPDVGTILEAKPELQKEAWWSKLVIPAATAAGGGERSSPTAEKLWAQAQLAVATGELTLPQAAAGLSTYFKVAVATNIANEQYNKVGMPVPQAYPVAITTRSGSFGRGSVTKLNMLDETRITFELAKTRLPSSVPYLSGE